MSSKTASPTHMQQLQELAEHCGIVTEYFDVFHEKHVTSVETTMAILKAMHVKADSPEETQRSLEDHRWKAWEHLIEPTMVFSVNDQPIRIPVHLPVDEGNEQIVSVSVALIDEEGRESTCEIPGTSMTVSEERWIDGKRYVRIHLALDARLEIGYYTAAIVCRHTSRGDDLRAVSTLIITPDTCYLPPGLENGRSWGLSLNLYAIRSSRNWGIGDFADLKTIARHVADLGGSYVGINPLHAIANEKPYAISPYSPLSRLYKNFIYLDVENIHDVKASKSAQKRIRSGSFQKKVAALRKTEFVGYERAAFLKEEILRHAFDHFYEKHHDQDTERGRDFQRYLDEEGEPLMSFAVFMALRENMKKKKKVYTWQEWPEQYRIPSNQAVQDVRKKHEKEVLYHTYVQWLISSQLAEITEELEKQGMMIGLYHDLAIGSDEGGSDAWNYQGGIGEARVGAPPDTFSPNGQNWGFQPMIAENLKETGYALFRATLRKNMQYGGALRIDHALSLFRLFWIPRDMSPQNGAYVQYPSEDLLRITALESVRNKTIVIAEDLGTVPKQVKEELQKFHMLSYRLFYFERNYPDPSFTPPEQYPTMALCAVTTHDLPTLSGYWVGRDIEKRQDTGKYPDAGTYRQQKDDRQSDKKRILRLLQSRGLLPAAFPDDPEGAPVMTPELITAVYRFLDSTPCKLLLVSLDDILGTLDQQNMPGTVDEYPNWMQKTQLDLEAMMADERFTDLAGVLTRTVDSHDEQSRRDS